MMILGALVSLGTALIAARLVEQRSPARLLFAATAVSAVLYGGEWALLNRAPQAVAITLYVHVSALGATFVAALWSVVNERFDPHTAKREVGRIALGGSFGGVLGGIAGWLVSGSRGVSYLLGMLLALNLVTMAAVVVLGRASRSLFQTREAGPFRAPPRTSALKALSGSPYLTTLAVFVALVALSSALLDYVMSARVVALYNDAARLAAFFALFHASLGVLAMFVQLVFTRAALERLGLAGTVALLPATVLGLGFRRHRRAPALVGGAVARLRRARSSVAVPRRLRAFLHAAAASAKTADQALDRRRRRSSRHSRRRGSGAARGIELSARGRCWC